MGRRYGVGLSKLFSPHRNYCLYCIPCDFLHVSAVGIRTGGADTVSFAALFLLLSWVGAYHLQLCWQIHVVGFGACLSVVTIIFVPNCVKRKRCYIQWRIQD